VPGIDSVKGDAATLRIVRIFFDARKGKPLPRRGATAAHSHFVVIPVVIPGVAALSVRHHLRGHMDHQHMSWIGTKFGLGNGCIVR
jgi:hypothetical protein